MRKAWGKLTRFLSLMLVLAVVTTSIPVSYASQNNIVTNQEINSATNNKNLTPDGTGDVIDNSQSSDDVGEKKNPTDVDISNLILDEAVKETVDEEGTVVTDTEPAEVLTAGEIANQDLTYVYSLLEQFDGKELLNEVMLYNIPEQDLNEILKRTSLEDIGEWLYNLPIEDQDYVLSLDTMLNDDVQFVDSEGNIEQESYMKYWELAQAQWFSTQISFFGWNDKFESGDTGRARFFIKFWCDGELVGDYTVDIPSVTQPRDGSTVDISTSTISGSLKKCVEGHDLAVKFSRIQGVNDSRDFWSGIRIFGQYTRPGGYVTTDYATNTAPADSYVRGFDVRGYTRFGTDTYGGNIGYNNKYLLDARYSDSAKVDEFVFEGNMYQIGLYDETSLDASVDNYGESTYHIDLMPSGKSYRVNPNGGYYNGSKENAVYSSTNSSDTVSITPPVWTSTTEGKTFTGWSLSTPVYLVSGSSKNLTSTVPKTEFTLAFGGAGKDGKYINKSMSHNKYGSYLSWDTSGVSELKAQWRLDWVKVDFNVNSPVSGSTPTIAYTSKNVWVGSNYNYGYSTDSATNGLPTPELYGYYFLGWYTSPTGNVKVDANTVCNKTGTHTLYARWQKALYKLTFNYNRPSGYENTTVSGMGNYANGKDIWLNKAYGYLPSNGANTNWPTPSLGSRVNFLGWFTAPVGGTKIENTRTFDSANNITLYAHWSEQLYLDVTTNTGYGSLTLAGRTFHPGGADLNWSEYKGENGKFNAFYRAGTSGNWTRILQKSTAKTFAAKTQVPDKAAPNKVNATEGTGYTLSKITNYTRVSIKKPTDRGTTYQFYVDEREYADASATTDKYTSVGKHKFTSIYDAKYKIVLAGAASGSGSKGGVGTVTGHVMDATNTIYMVVGGTGSGSVKGGSASGGHNGGGGGGSGYYGGAGGGGCTHVATSEVTYTSQLSSAPTYLAAGAGGAGGKAKSEYQENYHDSLGSEDTASGGSGGNAGSDGGSGGVCDASEGSPSQDNGGKANGTRGKAQSSSAAGYGGYVRTGGGGGGGGGWPGGGGGGSGGAYGSEHTSDKSDSNFDDGDGGDAGGNGYGGAGGNGSTYGSDNSDDRDVPCAAGAGGGGGGGTSKGVSISATNTGNGYVHITMTEDLTGTVLKESNVETEVITTGVVGYRYVINTSSTAPTIARDGGTFTTSNNIDVPNKSTAQYLHVVAQDGAGNISGVTSIYIEPTWTITYNLDGGTVSTANPGGYSPSTLPLTLNNPTQNGYEFIGWTGSNGSTPQMKVTLPTGTTGNKTYTANWAQDVPYVDQVKVNGDVYTKPGAVQEYFIQAGKVFDLSFNSHIKNKAGTVIYSKEYAVTNNYFQIKDRNGTFIQQYNAELGMAATNGYIGTWDKQDDFVLKIQAVTNTRTTSNKYFNSVTKAKLENHLDKVVVYPKAGVIKESKSKFSADFDDTKKLTITADGKAPIFTDNIIDDGVYDEGILPITVTTKDEDSGESGIKNLTITLQNIDTGYVETLANITNTSYVTSTSFTYKNSDGGSGLIFKDNVDNYVGEIKITIAATDNVNNKHSYSKTVYVISLDADIQRLLPTVDIDGNIIPDNVFKDGEQGEIVIDTTGYIDQIDIIFDEDIEKLAEEQEYEFKEDIIIPLPNNGDDKNINIRTTPTTDPDTLKPDRTDEYFFFVPDGTWKPNGSQEENTHYVVINAHKKDKILTNILTFGGTGEGDVDGDGIPDSVDPEPDVPDKNPVTDDNFIIDGALETEIRTRIRDGIN